LPSGSSDWSFAAWVKPTDAMSGAACFLMSCRTASSNAGYAIFLYPPSRVTIYNGGGGGDYSETDIIELNKWHHVAYSITGAIIKLYIDGILKYTANSGNNHIPNTYGIAIGGAQNSGGNANITN